MQQQPRFFLPAQPGPPPDPAGPPAPAISPPVVVLDTNVVLDCLVFEDPSCRALAAMLARRHWSWVASPPMRAELASVLARLSWRSAAIDSEYTLTVFDSLVSVCDDHASPPGAAKLRRCRDADDQKFLDLAFALGARWLFSRDRALLELAKPASMLGLEILTPALWSARNACLPTDSTPQAG
jgi:putative PIN family toxin of toxin-antitoxin system